MADQRESSSIRSESEDRLMSKVLEDIIDYDTGSLANSSVHNLDGGAYHPFDRRIGGSDEDTYQSQNCYKSTELTRNGGPREWPTTSDDKFRQ